MIDITFFVFLYPLFSQFKQLKMIQKLKHFHLFNAKYGIFNFMRKCTGNAGFGFGSNISNIWYGSALIPGIPSNVNLAN
jgi:hypothetical protein